MADAWECYAIGGPIDGTHISMAPNRLYVVPEMPTMPSGIYNAETLKPYTTEAKRHVYRPFPVGDPDKRVWLLIHESMDIVDVVELFIEIHKEKKNREGEQI